MFYPERIKSIKKGDRVLEIGPGATPYFRSDVFLELKYKTEEERVAQSGHVGVLETSKQIVYYDGGKFPFNDFEFDYVVCSHVLEHVNNPEEFLKEIQRVAKKGYLEFPTIYYDYLYNFPEHRLFLKEENNTIYWMTKSESGLNNYKEIQKFFYRTCELEYHDAIRDFKDYFFQGFEWFDKVNTKKVDNFDKLTFKLESIDLVKKNKSNNASNIINYNSVSLKKAIKFKLRSFFKRLFT